MKLVGEFVLGDCDNVEIAGCALTFIMECSAEMAAVLFPLILG